MGIVLNFLPLSYGYGDFYCGNFSVMGKILTEYRGNGSLKINLKSEMYTIQVFLHHITNILKIEIEFFSTSLLYIKSLINAGTKF